MPLFPNLSAEQVAAFHRLVGSPPCFLLLEAVPGQEGPTVYGHELYPRAWASHGFARRPVALFGEEEHLPLSPASGLLQPVSTWLEGDGLNLSSGAIALLFDATLPDEPIADFQARLLSLPPEAGLRTFTLVQRRGRQLFISSGRPLPTLPFLDSSLHFELWLEAANQLKVEGLKLPLTIGVQFPDPAEHSALLRVHAASLDSAQLHLPAERWYRLDPPPGPSAAPPRLLLDVCPRSDPAQDHWELSWSDGRGAITPVLAPPAVRVTARVLHLAIIFDRTCPDADSWPAARQLFFRKSVGDLSDTGAMAARGFEEADLPVMAPEPPAKPEDYNRKLREGFWPALRDSMGELPAHFHKVVIHPIWFGDTATPEFDPINEMPLNTLVVDALAPHALDPELDRVFRAWRYMPSYDVFDPLELALHAANERLRDAKSPARAAIIIVGNSPPTFVADEERRERDALAKYWDLARVQFCPRSRPGRVRWTTEVETAARRNVPIIYALLSLDPAAATTDQRRESVDFIMTMERCMRDALSLFSPKVRVTDAALANTEGLQRALGQALDLVAQSAGQQNPSSLILLDVGATAHRFAPQGSTESIGSSQESQSVRTPASGPPAEALAAWCQRLLLPPENLPEPETALVDLATLVRQARDADTFADLRLGLLKLGFRLDLRSDCDAWKSDLRRALATDSAPVELWSPHLRELERKVVEARERLADLSAAAPGNAALVSDLHRLKDENAELRARMETLQSKLNSYTGSFDR
jgi:hypothetical protein